MPTPAPSRRNVFLQGLAIQLTNPKALLFMSALVPQFINPQRSLLPQIVILTATTIVIDLGVLCTYAFCAERSLQSFRRRAIVAWLERIVGAALIFFGFRLLAARK
jgi:homoserine/homoserine lactone efflux protein